MKKIIWKSFTLIFAVLVILLLIGDFLTKINPYENFIKEFNESINREEEYAIFFYGSSKSFSSYNPRVFNELLGVNSFNFGSSAQRMPLTNFVIKETLKKQKPKLLVIDLYDVTLKSAFDKKIISYQLSCLDAFDFNFNKLEYALIELSPSDYLNLFVKAIRNHKGWKNIETNGIDDQKTIYLKEEVNGYRGWQYRAKGRENYVPLYTNKSKSKRKYILNNNQENNLRALLTTLNSYDVPYIFVTAPSLKELKNNKHDDFVYSIKTFLKLYNTDYIDLNTHAQAMGITIDDFRDITHLNNVGANKVSEYLAKLIYKEYGIGDLNTVEAKVERHITEGSFYKSGKVVGRKITDSALLKRIDYIESGNGKMSLIMELELKDIEDLDKYSIMFHAQPEDKYLSFLSEKSVKKKRKYEIWDFKPKVFLINDKYYLFKTIETKIRALKIINIGVYNADKYTGLLHDKITIGL